MRTIPQPQNQGLSPNLSAHAAAPAKHRELLVAAVFILTNSVTFFLIQYDRMRTALPGIESWIQLKYTGTLSNGDQYRIAIPFLLRFLELHAHLRPNQSLPLLEFLAYAFALTLLYLLFRDSPVVQQASYARRLVTLGLFMTAAQFPILWIFPWERPETLPTAFYLAAIVFLVTQRSRMPFTIVCLLAILLSLGQSLLRTDAPLTVGIAILLITFTRTAFPRSRSATATLGLLCLAVGSATQLYLQYVMFPLKTPTQTPLTFRILTNFNPFDAPIHVPEFVAALLPFFLSLYFIRRYRLLLEFSDKLALLICLLYLPLYLAIGLVVEVRIYVPYLFLASPTIAKVWTAFLFSDQPQAQPPLAAANP